LPGFDRYFLTMPPTVFPVFREIFIAGQEIPFFGYLHSEVGNALSSK